METVQVAGDLDGASARSGISPELGEITIIRSGRVFIALTDDGASQCVLDLARSAGVVEHFSHRHRGVLAGRRGSGSVNRRVSGREVLVKQVPVGGTGSRAGRCPARCLSSASSS